VRAVAPRRARRVRARLFHAADYILDLRARDRARAQQGHAAAEAGDDRGLEAHLAFPAVEHEADAVAQLLAHVGRTGRADAPVTVRRWRRDAAPEGREQRARDRVRGRPQGDARLAAGHLGRHALRLWKHQRERAGPERIRKPCGGRRHLRRPGARRGEVAEVDDQRVRGGPALGDEDARHRERVLGVGAEAIDRLGRERHEFARVQQGDRLFDRCDVRAHSSGMRFQPVSVRRSS
jgi:hypothetical protein